MGLLKTAGKVAVATRVHGNVQRRQQRRWAQQDLAAAAAAPPPPATPPVASSAPPPPADTSIADMLALLAQLGALRDSGVLTDDEFETQKAHILKNAQRQ
ncbi:Short C-terminal domain-containing protein [Nocardioides alpinus]|uniref:Short C-terminal domain-containing protein n=2 Tax=Nocardioides alpinus TaxID=748909 RepID=A0A1I1BB15_9ACTN|nr:SHOCT domain-containing protein [Nocardioides alpinus]PKH40515.1 hypothetical protein CXG46_12895 [Nocardioides alpinus]SFB47297.1 Short C-terminal domain-containing protein [Nocardioides alpinus]